MSPDALARVEGLEHHGRGVPAQEVFQAPFHPGLPGIAGLEMGGNGIQIGRIQGRLGHDQPGLGRKLLETPQEFSGAFIALEAEHRRQRIEPLLHFLRPSGLFLPTQRLLLAHDPLPASAPSIREPRPVAGYPQSIFPFEALR